MIRPPCRSCPWRVDTSAEQIPNFSLELAERLAACQSDQIGAPVFACHLGRMGEEFACAGWLAVHGRDSIAVRLMLVRGELDPAALGPAPGWPELHVDYAEMMEKLRS